MPTFIANQRFQNLIFIVHISYKQSTLENTVHLNILIYPLIFTVIIDATVYLPCTLTLNLSTKKAKNSFWILFAIFCN